VTNFSLTTGMNGTTELSNPLYSVASTGVFTLQIASMSNSYLYFKGMSYNPSAFTVDKVRVTVCGGHNFAVINQNSDLFNILFYKTGSQVWEKFPLLNVFKTTGGNIPDNSCPITAGIVCR